MSIAGVFIAYDAMKNIVNWEIYKLEIAICDIKFGWLLRFKSPSVPLFQRGKQDASQHANLDISICDSSWGSATNATSQTPDWV